MKIKKLCIISIALILLNSFTVKASTKQINVIINGNNVQFTEKTGYPYTDKNNRIMVPLRTTMEACGTQVGYDTKKKTAIIITHRGRRIEVPINTNLIYESENDIIQNDTNSVINNGRVYLPIRKILESIDYTVEWDNKTQTVNVYSFKFDNKTFVPYSTSDISLLIEQILKGNVIYINGGYYATPDYVKMLANTELRYFKDLNSDLNTAIYFNNNTQQKTNEPLQPTIVFGCSEE